MMNFFLFVSLFLFVNLASYAQKLVVQSGHSSTITDIQFSHDGKFIASAGEDNNIVIWDINSSKQLLVLHGHKARVNSISFHSKKNIIASASDDKTVKIWEYPTAKLIRTFSFNYEINSLVFGPDSDILYCGSKKLFSIDLQNNKVYTFKFKANKYFSALAISNDGIYIAFSGPYEKNIICINSDEKIIKTIHNKANQLCFGPENNNIYIAGNKGNMIKIPVNEDGGKRLNYTASQSWHSFFDICANQKYVIGANKNGLIYVNSKKNGKTEYILNGHYGEVRTLALGSNGKYLISAGKDRNILIWSLENGNLLGLLSGTGNQVNTIKISPNNKSIFIGYLDGSYRLLDLTEKANNFYNTAPELGFLKQYLRWSYTVDDAVFIDDNSIAIKILLQQQHKHNLSIRQQKSELLIWAPNKNNENEKIGNAIKYYRNKKNTEYISFSLSDSLIHISQIQQSHPQQQSILNTNFESKPVVFSTKLSTCNYNYLKQLNSFSKCIDKKTSKIIKGNLIYQATNRSGNITAAISFNSNKNNTFIVKNIDTNLSEYKKLVSPDFNYVGFSNDSKFVYLVSSLSHKIVLYQLPFLNEYVILNGNYPIDFDNQNRFIYYTDSLKNLVKYDLKNKKETFKIATGHISNISSTDISPNNSLITTASQDGLIKIWNNNTGTLKLALTAFGENEYIFITPNNDYFSTKKAIHYIGFLMNNKVYSFDQFDIKYNRPDLVFSQMGYTDIKVLDAYYYAYKKRIQKLGFDEQEISGKLSVPELKVLNLENLPFAVKDSIFKINVIAEDSLYNLKKLNIWTNNVPIYGSKGFDLTKRNIQNLTEDIELQLIPGNNLINISATNQIGSESLQETFTIFYETNKTSSNLYLVSIGISEYMDETLNLKYAAKDALDIAHLFKSNNKKYNNVFIKTIINDEVTKENIKSMKSFLEKSRVNDIVILFVAGHGLFDDDYNYYIATHDINFENPSEKGLQYEELENLLDGIPALKKIMLIDACHSGEIDKEEGIILADFNNKNSNVKYRSVGQFQGVKCYRKVNMHHFRQLRM